MLTDEVKKELSFDKNKKNLIITIGNTFRSDDGIGPYIFNKLALLPDFINVLNAEDKPENIIDQAIEIMPEKTIIIDAATFNGAPGEARIIPKECIPDSTLSTHTFPPKIIAKILEEDTKSPVLFLGIQPINLTLGESISPEVKKTGDQIAGLINGHR